MVKSTVVVKSFEEGKRWYIGVVKAMLYMLSYEVDNGPTIEHKYTIDFEDEGDSLFHALNHILEVKYWGAVMYDMVDKTKYPQSRPDCFWERYKEVPTAQSCMNDYFRKYQHRTLRDIGLGDDIYVILWDTCASGSEEPGVHVPQDNMFSGIRYESIGQRDESDRHLSREYIEHNRQKTQPHESINVHGQDKSMNPCANNLCQMSVFVQICLIMWAHF
jgi:hypothetical protein